MREQDAVEFYALRVRENILPLQASTEVAQAIY